MMTNVPTSRWILCAAMTLAPVAASIDDHMVLVSSNYTGEVSFEDAQGNARDFKGIKVEAYDQSFKLKESLASVELVNTSCLTVYTLHGIRALFYAEDEPTPQNVPLWSYTLNAKQLKAQSNHRMRAAFGDRLSLDFHSLPADDIKLEGNTIHTSISTCRLVVMMEGHTDPGIVASNVFILLIMYYKTTFLGICAILGTLVYLRLLQDDEAKEDPKASTPRRRAARPRQASSDKPSMPSKRQPDKPSTHASTPSPLPTRVAQA